jgi:hypothetical protein
MEMWIQTVDILAKHHAVMQQKNDAAYGSNMTTAGVNVANYL